MESEALLESLDRHFLAGCRSLSVLQLRWHKDTGACPECRDGAAREAASVQSTTTPPSR